MLGAVGYKTKKELKEAVNKSLNYIETTAFKPEYKPDGKVMMVGPDAYNKRSWYAEITMENGLIKAVK